MDYKIISLPSPNVEHILSKESPSNLKTKYYWKFKTDYKTQYTTGEDGIEIIVPKGFESDGGTIPRLFGYFSELAFRGYFVHDYIYTTNIYPRKEADKILKSCLEYEGVSFIDRNLIYLAVRLFGAKHYKGE